MTIDSDELERDGAPENYLVCENERPMAILLRSILYICWSLF